MKSLLILVDQLNDWGPYYPTNQVVAISDYLGTNHTENHAETRGYVINLCHDYSYLSSGYYGSLLAEARGGQVGAADARHGRRGDGARRRAAHV